jgi:hypothetical protein
MESKEKNHETDEVQQFIRDNFQILALIGVFTAVAKYSTIDESNRNSAIAFLSIMATLLVIFLLFIFLIGAARQIVSNTRDRINQGFFEFVRLSISDIVIMIIVILVALITLFLIGVLILQFPEQLQISLLLIETIIGLVIAAILGVYILIRVRTFQASFIAAILVWIFLVLVVKIIDVENYPHVNPFSPSAHLIAFVVIVDVLCPLTFLKFSYYFFKEIQKLFKNGDNF